jgi:hypothetical protein
MDREWIENEERMNRELETRALVKNVHKERGLVNLLLHL